MKTTGRRSYLSLVWLIALLPLASGTGSLSGTVRDAGTNQPVAGAAVTIKIADERMTVPTDAQGHYSFPNLPPGSGFAIKVVKPSYEEYKGSCPEIKDGGNSKKDILIAPAGSGMGATGGTGKGKGKGKGKSGGGNGGGGAPVAAEGRVRGVVSSGGQPLAGVTVKVGPREAVSGGDGSYSVKLPAGSYPVVAKKDGFKKFEGSVTVSPGSDTTGNIELQPKK